MAFQLCQDLSEGCSHQQPPLVPELCDLVLSQFAEFYCCKRAQLSCSPFVLWSSLANTPQRGRRLVGERSRKPWQVLAGECSLCCVPRAGTRCLLLPGAVSLCLPGL